MGFVLNYLMNLGGMLLRQPPARPLLFSYYVTHRCDLACGYCSDGDGKRFKEERIPELPTADARRLLSILRRAGDTLDITGGEPLLREDLEEILRHARQLGFRTVLNTKGIGLDERPDVMRYADVLVLSVDTLDPGRLASVIGRSQAVAEQVLLAVHYAMRMRQQFGTRVVLSAVATPDGIGDVAGVLHFAADNALGFHLSPEVVGTTVNGQLRGHVGYRALIDDVIRMKRKHRGVLGVPAYLEGIRDFSPFVCHPLLMPVIRPDGRMYYPCLESKQAEISPLDTGSYWSALAAAQRRYGNLPRCGNCCHIFCHMGLSLLQRHPLDALAEMRHMPARPKARPAHAGVRSPGLRIPSRTGRSMPVQTPRGHEP